MPDRVINLEHNGWKRLSDEEKRRADAESAFRRREKADKHILSLVKFWMAVSGVLFITLVFVLIAWLSGPAQ
ncbi:MAG: hypothetical protein ACYTEX_11225 [Planctomycetota bacterium]